MIDARRFALVQRLLDVTGRTRDQRAVSTIRSNLSSAGRSEERKVPHPSLPDLFKGVRRPFFHIRESAFFLKTKLA